MSEYKVLYTASATPIEVVTLVDGVTTQRNIHSDIDKIIGGSIEKSASTTSTNIKAKLPYRTTAVGVSIEHADIFNDNLGAVVDFLVVSIKDAGSTGTPDVELTVDGANYEHVLSGIGDFMVLRLANLDSANILIRSSGATEVADVDILRAVSLT